MFDGGFDYEQAAQVVEPRADGGDVLDRLGDARRPEPDQTRRDRDGIRFEMLETIRAFALERLRDEGREELRRRHAVAYLALAETAAPNLTGPDQPRWLDRLTIDYPNLRAAIRWSIDTGEAELALRFVAAMWRYWQQDGRSSRRPSLPRVSWRCRVRSADISTVSPPSSAAGGIAYWHGRREDSFRRYEEELTWLASRGRRVRGRRDLEPVLRAVRRRGPRGRDGDLRGPSPVRADRRRARRGAGRWSR